MSLSLHLQLRFVTAQSIHDTVIYDAQTYLWFQKLCSHPDVKERICAHGEDSAALYRRYRWLSWLGFGRRSLATLASRLVDMDLSEFPAGVTLYQLGEIYSRRYGIPSLVDVIWQWNVWMRTTVVLVYFAAFGVYFLSFPLMIFWTSAACFLVLFILKAGLMKKHRPHQHEQHDKPAEG
ncbi:MAG: hypothetical protein HQL22_11140 [Candidatus Omnitrophica bacterium]|nr:hypothetical protein [Candidatus Omnitrophota bacterium]